MTTEEAQILGSLYSAVLLAADQLAAIESKYAKTFGRLARTLAATLPEGFVPHRLRLRQEQ